MCLSKIAPWKKLYDLGCISEEVNVPYSKHLKQLTLAVLFKGKDACKTSTEHISKTCSFPTTPAIEL